MRLWEQGCEVHEMSSYGFRSTLIENCTRRVRKLFYCGKGLQNFASNVTLYPCERSRENHLVISFATVFYMTMTKHR